MRVGRHQLYVLGGGSVLFTTDLCRLVRVLGVSAYTGF